MRQRQGSTSIEAQKVGPDSVSSLTLRSSIRLSQNSHQGGLPVWLLTAADNTKIMSSSYRYKRLDHSTNAIRLLRILKGAAGPIGCEMSETYLNEVEGVPYEALSYVWGNEESAEKILVDGCEFTVTENLFEALSNLRQPEDDRLLWVDAICIDQSYDAVSNFNA